MTMRRALLALGCCTLLGCGPGEGAGPGPFSEGGEAPHEKAIGTWKLTAVTPEEATVLAGDLRYSFSESGSFSATSTKANAGCRETYEQRGRWSVSLVEWPTPLAITLGEVVLTRSGCGDPNETTRQRVDQLLEYTLSFSGEELIVSSTTHELRFTRAE
jgi:hypothetical protein